MTDDIAARIAWIGADWGTTRLRLFAFDDADEIIASRTDGPGMNALKPDEFEPALARLGWTFRDTGKLPPVLICGMAGARQGWMEAPYVELPATLDLIVGGAVTVPCAASVGPVRILPGLCYRYPPAPDVVRGEETQALGLVATAGPGDVTLVMPGTHSKWLDLRDGVVTSSHTFMTGEVFDLLARQSVLRHSLTADGFDDTAFLRGVREGAHRPDLLLSRLFHLRAADLLYGGTAETRTGRLSGLLIGAELATGLATTGDASLAIVGSATLAERYRAALNELGREAVVHDGDRLVTAGLVHAWRHLQG